MTCTRRAALWLVIATAMLWPQLMVAAQDSAEATPASREIDTTPFLFSPDPPSVSFEEPSEPAVVDVGYYDPYNGYPVLVYNPDGDETLAYPVVQAEVRTADGRLYGASNGSIVAPQAILAGGYAVGFVTFDDVEIEPSMEVQFQVTGGSEASDFIFLWDLEVTETEVYPDRIVGIVRNPSREYASSLVIVFVGCFSSEGKLITIDRGDLSLDVAPGQTGPFQFARPANKTCDHYVVSALGY